MLIFSCINAEIAPEICVTKTVVYIDRCLDRCRSAKTILTPRWRERRMYHMMKTNNWYRLIRDSETGEDIYVN